MNKPLQLALVVLGSVGLLLLGFAGWWVGGLGKPRDQPSVTEGIAPASQPAPAVETQPAVKIPAGAAGRELTLDLGDQVALKLVLIPAGKFLMGSPETEKNRKTIEVQHEVTISKPFYLGVTHVTVDQFAAFVKDSGYVTDAEKAGTGIAFEVRNGKFTYTNRNGCTWRNPSFEQTGNHPVVQTTWNDAQAFCGWLANKSGRAAGLPTEAQWEYACRAGTTTAYPWGDDPDAGKGWANCADRRLKSLTVNDTQANYYFGWDDGFAFTSPVGSFTPNAFGLCDMLGNAMQWCQDVRGDYDTGAVTDPVQAATAKNGAGRRVVRGGSWVDGLPDCRAAYRFEFKPDYRDECSGFRVAATAGAE